MIIADFTEPELDYFREHCGFVGDELLVFELRCRKVSLQEIADILSVSIDTAKKISRRVNRKIINVI